MRRRTSLFRLCSFIVVQESMRSAALGGHAAGVIITIRVANDACYRGEMASELADIGPDLLVLLDALVEERHGTRAGSRLGLSQPATSRALSRLRAVLGDPLLVRSKTGLVPTARAAALAEPVRRLLGEATRLLRKE